MVQIITKKPKEFCTLRFPCLSLTSRGNWAFPPPWHRGTEIVWNLVFNRYVVPKDFRSGLWAILKLGLSWECGGQPKNGGGAAPVRCGVPLGSDDIASFHFKVCFESSLPLFSIWDVPGCSHTKLSRSCTHFSKGVQQLFAHNHSFPLSN